MTDMDFSHFEEFDLEVRAETDRLISRYGYERVTDFKMFQTLSGLEFRILGTLNFFKQLYS